LPITDPVYQRGLKFLLKTQHDDGTWHVATRLYKPAPLSPPMFSSGFPHGKDQFVSLFGTTWAVTSILHALPSLVEENVRYDFRELAPDVKDEWVRVALNGNAEELKKLLDGGMDPNSKTPSGTTALMLAARDSAKVKLLLERGADAKARAKSGFDALLVASRFHGSGDVIRQLLKSGATANPGKDVQVQFNASPIYFASATGDLDIVGTLLDAGAKPNQRMNMLGKIGGSPLQYVVSNGDAAMVELLLKRGGDPNEIDPDDKISLLGWAAITNNAAVIDVLLARGAKVDHKDDYGMTPLLFAASIDYGDTEVIEKLLAAGANVKAKTNGGKTALDLAKGYSHGAIAERLAKVSTPK
jgi:ankyrin repeat protein